MSDTPTTPAGWYDDGSGRRRYWDGAAWTDHYESAPATPAGPSAPTQAYGSGSTDAYGSAPTQAYGSGSTDAYGSAPTQAYGSGSADAYGSAPTQAYGSGSTQAYGAQPTQAYGAGSTPPSTASGQYGATPQYAAPQYGAGPQYGPPAGYGARTPQPADAKPSVLGLIALGIAALGLVLAFVPIATIGSWVLLPIAVVLAIVAFFVRGRKWPAITALIISVVGGIVAIVMGFVFAFLALGGVVSNLPDTTDGDGDGTTIAPPSGDGDTGDATDGTGQGDGAGSSPDDPLPLGTTITGEEYTVVINSVTLNADDEVLAANEFNEPAGDGLSWAIVNATYTYTGADSGLGVFVFIDFLASDGSVYSVAEPYATPPDPDISFVELNPGEPTTGNVVIAIPTDADGVLKVTPGILDDAVYVAVR